MKRKKWKTLRIAVMLAPVVGLVTAFPAKADVVYTTFGTSICGGDATCIANNGINQNYDPIDGPSNTISPFETEMIADSFTPTANFTLSDVQLVLQNLGQGDANVYLTSDGGGTPGCARKLDYTRRAFRLDPAQRADTHLSGDSHADGGNPVLVGCGAKRQEQRRRL